MKFFDPNNPNEKKKMIAAGALALAAILVLGYVFFGGGSSKPPTTTNAIVRSSPSPARSARPKESPEPPVEDLSIYQPVSFTGTVASASEADRNIFSYYEPPPPTPKPVIIPTPSPTPTPPLVASGVSPSSVYARTPSDFSLQLTGDKFTPAVRIVIDGRELPTRFIGPQQLFTTVPASLVTNPGVRQLMARTSDGHLYSNTVSLNVSQPPVPNFNYVGLIGKPRFNDIAVLQDKSSKDLNNVQRGDPVGGRFRVVSISEKEVVLIDTALKIRHTLPFTQDPNSGAPFRTTPRVSEEPE
ncbi:MAG TPA: hypothetical protein VNG71_05225 [Pyrinomonadaceae bacterium]|nr:hypothetical protein [Pyrinomonadaceae bacterium]